LREALEVALGESVRSLDPVAGGDINLAFRVETEAGSTYFLKTRPGSDRSEFEDEAAGLAWLAEPGGLPCPRPVCVIEDGGSAGLVLEWIDSGRGTDWAELGRGLATFHSAHGAEPGVRPPGSDNGGVRFGSLRLPSVPPGSGLGFAEVYGERIAFLVGKARDRGALEPAAGDRLLGLAERVPDLVGAGQHPSRLHGDLWSGNLLTGADGRPWLIDPAAYGGDCEVDLAMLELFGSPPEAFYRAYGEVRPVPDGLAERRPLWQVQPLLIHAVLFGGGYGAAADRAAGTLI
jgi:fructosamine-3-kinase